MHSSPHARPTSPRSSYVFTRQTSITSPIQIHFTMPCCTLPHFPRLPHFRRFWPKSWKGGCLTSSISDVDTVASAELYSNLKRDEIRLLTFKSLHKSDPIELQMQTVTLGTHSYQALSYVWGDPDVTERIQVNDCTINITENLYAALDGMRRDYQRPWGKNRKVKETEAACDIQWVCHVANRIQAYWGNGGKVPMPLLYCRLASLAY